MLNKVWRDRKIFVSDYRSLYLLTGNELYLWTIRYTSKLASKANRTEENMSPRKTLLLKRDPLLELTCPYRYRVALFLYVKKRVILQKKRFIDRDYTRIKDIIERLSFDV